MEPSSLLGITRHVPHKKFPRKPYNKFFIDQACLVKMAGHWPHSFFFCKFIDLDSVSIHRNAKKRTWPISSHLELTQRLYLVNNQYNIIYPWLQWKKETSVVNLLVDIRTKVVKQELPKHILSNVLTRSCKVSAKLHDILWDLSPALPSQDFQTPPTARTKMSI